MNKRVIYLPAIERHVSLGAYVGAITTAKASPPSRMFKTGLDSWWPTSAAEIMRQFHHALNRRITEAVPYTERGKPRGTRP